MDTNNYLNKVLKSQDLADDSRELKDLQEHRRKVEQILRDGFPESSPTIQYGGSKAKRTLNKESYDLDVVCYFCSDDTRAGQSLKEIFEGVSSKLGSHYFVEPKTSALRLHDKSNQIDFHIDVVPGRYVDDSKSDCFIYQNSADKCRMKTNLNVHIAHIRDSGVIPAVRLIKLWNTRRGLGVKQFVLDLLVVKLLKEKKSSGLDSQLQHVWSRIAEAERPIPVEDPANPAGNDLTPILERNWSTVSARAHDTLELINRSGWQAVFGAVDDEKATEDASRILVSVAANSRASTKPWLA